MRKVSLKELVDKKVVWVREDGDDCIYLKTEDGQHFMLGVDKVCGVLYAPQLHECTEAQASELVLDDPY